MELLSFYAVVICILKVQFVQVLAVPTSCESGKYYNGTDCIPCSLCPPGQGAKVKCKGRQDTACYDCVDKFDYSANNSSTSGCLDCRNCLAESLIISAHCTIKLNTICTKCPEGKYFYFETGQTLEPVCLPCTSCGHDEIEVQACTYRSKRICEPKSTQEPPTTTVTVKTGKKSNTDEPADSIPVYVFIIVAVGFAMFLCLLSYWVYKRFCARKAPDEPVRVQPVEPGNAVTKKVTEDTHFRDLPADVRRNINIELSHLSKKPGIIGINLEAIAHEADFSNDFIQLRLKNSARYPGDEFIHEFESRADATLGVLKRIMITAEKKYDNGHESRLRQYITKVLMEGKHPTPHKAEETTPHKAEETQV